MEKIFITAARMESDAWDYARRLHAEGLTFDGIIGVTRGGAQISIYMHEVFWLLQGKAPGFGLVQARSYTGIGEAGGVRVTGVANLAEWVRPGFRILVVDDVFDRGRTLEVVQAEIREALRELDVRIHVGALYIKPGSAEVEFRPDSYQTAFPPSAWLVFPHELVGLSPEERAQKGFGR